MGYPNDILMTRSLLKPGICAVIPPEGLVNNSIPYFENCKISVVASPKMGASFAQYVVEINPGGGSSKAFGCEENIESFLYCIEGEGIVEVDGKTIELVSGAYIYAPPSVGIKVNNNSQTQLKILFYKQHYVKLSGVKEPAVVVGNTNDIEYEIYDGMENVHVKDLLPTDLSFDLNMHILSFEPGGCHPFIETHVQEHGAYILEGEGMYLLDKEWMPIKKNDFLWFGPYVTQGAYGVGLSNFTYIYSKDSNRDVLL